MPFCEDGKYFSFGIQAPMLKKKKVYEGYSTNGNPVYTSSYSISDNIYLDVILFDRRDIYS